MKTISASLQQKIDNGQIPEVTAVMTQKDGTSLTLTGDDFMDRSFSFSSATTDEGAFEVGKAIISSFGFALNNFDGKFDTFNFNQAMIDPVLDYGDSDTIAMGRYYFAKHKTVGHAIRCESYDALKLLDEGVVEFTFPITCAAAIQKICNDNLITLATPTFPYSDFVLTQSAMDMTYRQALIYIAEICGCFAVMRSDGLHVEWYDTANMHSVDVTFAPQNISTSNVQITGVVVYPYGSDARYIVGTSDYTVAVQNNPLITDVNARDIAENIALTVIGMTFRSGSIDMLANPAFEAGDVLTLADFNGNTIVMPYTTVYYRVTLRQRLQCDAVAPEENDLRPIASTGKQGAQGEAGIIPYIVSDKGGSIAAYETTDVTLTGILGGLNGMDIDPDGTNYKYIWWCAPDNGTQEFIGVGKSIDVTIDSDLCDDFAGIWFTTDVEDLWYTDAAEVPYDDGNGNIYVAYGVS